MCVGVGPSGSVWSAAVSDVSVVMRFEDFEVESFDTSRRFLCEALDPSSSDAMGAGVNCVRCCDAVR